MRGPGSILTGGSIFSLDCLCSCSKASDANIGIIATSVSFVKTPSVGLSLPCNCRQETSMHGEIDYKLFGNLLTTTILRK